MRPDGLAWTVIVDSALYRDGARVPVDCRPRPADIARGRRRGGDFVWVGLHEPTAAELERRRRRLRTAPAGGGGRRQGPPAAQARALRRQPVPDPQDALVRRRRGRRGDRGDQPVRRPATSWSPSATATARAAAAPASAWRGASSSSATARPPSSTRSATRSSTATRRSWARSSGRRRGRVVGLLRRAHQRLGPDLRPQARAGRGTARGAAAARADHRFAAGAVRGIDPDAAPFFRDVADHLARRRGDRRRPRPAAVHGLRRRTWPRSRMQQNDDMRKISARRPDRRLRP